MTGKQICTLASPVIEYSLTVSARCSFSATCRDDPVELLIFSSKADRCRVNAASSFFDLAATSINTCCRDLGGSCCRTSFFSRRMRTVLARTTWSSVRFDAPVKSHPANSGTNGLRNRAHTVINKEDGDQQGHVAVMHECCDNNRRTDRSCLGILRRTGYQIALPNQTSPARAR